jgi:hypothetical protein
MIIKCRVLMMAPWINLHLDYRDYLGRGMLIRPID